jgi:gas vesicle protein
MNPNSTFQAPHSRRSWILHGLLPAGAAVALAGTCFLVRNSLSKSAESSRAQALSEAQKAAEKRQIEAERLRRAQERAAEKNAQARREISKKAKTHLAEAKTQDAEAREKIRREFQDTVNRIHDSAVREAGPIAAKMSEFREVAKLALLLAKDQIKGTQDSAGYLSESLKAVSHPMASLPNETQISLQKVRYEIESHTNAISTSLQEDIQHLEMDTEVHLESLKNDLGQMFAGIKSHDVELSAAVLLAPLEFSGVLALRTLLVRMLGPVVRRAVTTAGINAALVVVDGPLPIGDLLALAMDAGFLFWASYDIYQISKELPGKIEEQIRLGLQKQRDSALAQFDEKTANWLTAAHSARTEALKPLIDPR